MKRLSVISAFLLVAIMSGPLIAQRGGPPPVSAAPGPMLDAANKIVDAINKKDAAALQKMATPDCVPARGLVGAVTAEL